MRTTIDIPDDLYQRIKVTAAVERITLRELLLRALDSNAGTNSTRTRRNPPLLPRGKKKGRLLTREEIDALMFG